MTTSPVRVERPGGLGRTFNALWSATGTANLGDAMYLMVLPLIALRLTSSAGLVAGVTVVLTLAWPLFGLHAGAVVDRVDRRRLIVVVNLVRALTLGVLTVLLLGDLMSIGWVYLAALVLGVGETLVDTALAALVPASVDRPENLDRANARLEVAQNVTNQFVGPPLAGLLAIVGLAAVTGVGALLFLATVPLLALMRGSYRVAAVGARGGDGVTAGLRFLWRNRLLRNLTLLTAAMNVFWAAWTAVLVVYLVAPGPGHLSTAAYGVLLTTMAAGGIVGAALVVPLRRRLGDHLLLAVDVLGTIVLIGTPAVTTNPFAIGAAMAVGGAGSAVWRVIVGVVRQTVTPADLLGRVYSASRVISWGVLPVGAALGGLIAELWTVRTVFVVGGLASVGLLLAYAVTVRPKDLASR
ncbi:MFS transporter [Virgisporangium aurantiacum]|nr:MFS transporter [Virgisporangium aurantiacum]